MDEVDPILAVFGSLVVGAGVALVLFFWNTTVSPVLRGSLGGNSK